MSLPNNVYALILAGGAGTRFWPASRKNRPKQLLSLGGEDPLLVRTIRRVLPLLGDASWSHILIASGKHLAEPTCALVPELPTKNLLLEPVPRNTAPCIGWAASVVARENPNAIVIAMPSDAHVADVSQFQATLNAAVGSAQKGIMTTIGIEPTYPATGYGYIELVEPLSDNRGLDPCAVRRFVEKPTLARAEEFIKDAKHLWNAGIFVFRACDMLDAIQRYMPELALGLSAIDEAACVGKELDALDRIFPTLPNVSIDYGVMEHVQSLAVVPGNFGWNDLGSWESAWELAPKDPNGNAITTKTIAIDARNNLVMNLQSGLAATKTIALVGIDDMVVVETDDALLVIRRDKSQDVKNIIDILKQKDNTLL